jgi:hypothetical protein
MLYSELKVNLQWPMLYSELKVRTNNLLTLFTKYCESTFIRWYQFSWFLQNVLIRGFLNSWFQTLHATVNMKVVCRWILIFVV